MDGKMKQEGFVSLVRRAGKGIAIIVDEANLALPKDGNDAKAETAKAALAQITCITKQNLKGSVVLISSEHGYPFKLAKAGLNLVDIQNIIIAPEVPPDDAREHLINIALDGFSPVSDYETDEGIIPKMAKRPGLWPEVFHETDEEYVLVASTHHVRLKICEALLNKGYIQNN
eukprot:s2788_g1.t1